MFQKLFGHVIELRDQFVPGEARRVTAEVWHGCSRTWSRLAPVAGASPA